MKVPDGDVVIVRHGDIGVKSGRVQSWMEQTLASNLTAMLTARSVEGQVSRQRGRLFIRTNSLKAATEAAASVFGVVSASPARTVESQIDTIASELADLAESVYEDGSFAVEASRVGDHDFTSQDVGQIGGTAIWEAVEDRFEPEVDLDDPDYRFEVEIREEDAYLFLERLEGPGGLPVGTQAPLVALISGGIDSPVAAWLAMKRGAPIVPLYFDLGQFGGVDHRTRAIDTIETLATYAPDRDWTIRIVPIGEPLEKLVEQVGDTRMLSVRRLMLLAAGEIADSVGAEGLVTGEALGQKSSQTVTNLHRTDQVTEWPVHRPLLTYDKQEIIEMARSIGTYETATIDTGCDRIAPDQPETGADPQRVENAEPEALRDWAKTAASEVELLTIDSFGMPQTE